MPSLFIKSCSIALISLGEAISFCPPLGPIYPKVESPSSIPSIQAAAANLSYFFKNALSNGISEFDSNTTSFSVNIFSAHEQTSIFELHYTAPSLNTSATGPVVVDADTVYRVGSISKVFTVLEILLLDGKASFEDPVAKYIPELEEIIQAQEKDGYSPVREADWAQITIGALCSLLSGLGRDWDLTAVDMPWTDLGFPALNASQIPSCGRDPHQSPCSRKDFFTNFPKRHPVYATDTTPVYSNAAFTILGYVIENITGLNYAEAIQKDIFVPLSLTRTSVEKPANDSWGVIPVGESGWDYDLGGESPSGSIYTSTKSLSNFARTILLSPLARSWLKPRAHTASLFSSVGAPWEIYRSASLTSDTRVIDIFTKSGGIGLYGSLLVLIPDYNIAVTVMVAGDSTTTKLLAETVVHTFIPLIDTYEKEVFGNIYAGKYLSSTNVAVSNSTSISSLDIQTDGGPGLAVKQWISNGRDILAEYKQLLDGGSQNIVDMRLYATLLDSSSTSSSSGLANVDLIREHPLRNHGDGNRATNGDGEASFRAIIQLLPRSDSSSTASSGFLSNECGTWYGIDGYVYGGRALDDFVFRVDADRRAVGLDVRVMRETLNRM